MDRQAWLLQPALDQRFKFLGMVDPDATSVDKLTTEIYEAWLILFDQCKFMLHNFD